MSSAVSKRRRRTGARGWPVEQQVLSRRRTECWAGSRASDEGPNRAPGRTLRHDRLPTLDPAPGVGGAGDQAIKNPQASSSCRPRRAEHSPTLAAFHRKGTPRPSGTSAWYFLHQAVTATGTIGQRSGGRARRIGAAAMDRTYPRTRSPAGKAEPPRSASSREAAAECQSGNGRAERQRRRAGAARLEELRRVRGHDRRGAVVADRQTPSR